MNEALHHDDDLLVEEPNLDVFRSGELPESELCFRQLAETIDAILWILEPQTLRTLYMSPAYERVMGLSCASAYEYPSSWQSAVDPADRPALFAMLAEVAQGRPSEAELRITRGDGARRWLKARGFPIHDAVGRVVRLSGVAEDITEQKAASERISSLVNMLDHARDAVVVRDFDSMIVRFWNKGAESLYQCSPENAVGKIFSDLIALVDLDWDTLRFSLLEKGEWRGEVRVRRPNKSSIIVNARSTLIRDAAGQPQSILHIATDITEQKRVEQQLLRAQRLDSVGTLATGVAHDLTNILSPILLSAPLLEEDLDPSTKKAIIDTIRTCARRGTDVVRQILTFARGVEGERILINPRLLFQDLEFIIEQTFPRRISLSCDYAGNIWPVIGDPTQLHQVLLNLAINARDAMPDGGSLAIAAKNFVVDESFASMIHEAKPGHYVILEVTDTGTGIPKDLLEKIFDPFFTTKRVGEGMGLGLSSVSVIVKSHGGFITVESEPGHGSKFKIFIPASPDGVDATVAPEVPPQLRGNGETILLVDDESVFLIVVGTLLRQAGYEVLISTDGTDALAAYMMHRPDIKLVVTDATMPFLDGASLTRALRQIDPSLKVIGTSGHANDARVHELKSLNLSGFVIKPFEGPTLVEAVHRALHPEP